MFPALLIYLVLIFLLVLSVAFSVNVSYKWMVGLALLAIGVQLGYYALRMTGVIHVDCYFN
jgi:heme/copper-type cytochrome/quinol oxidase subunit 4